ncbi:MAG: UDP-N-acetylmuramate--L-alanine ligase [Chloroflexi bacterium]|nr:UDP-N-acetylmuramate--L-alanine ligase [Chloroflexota bacterium]
MPPQPISDGERGDASHPRPLSYEERGETPHGQLLSDEERGETPHGQLLSDEERGVRRIHFVGVGGAGLSALARVMLGRGFVVSGSDATASRVTDDLADAGVKIFVGHAAENIAGADLIVVTSAAPADNPEIVAAQAQNIPLLRRREFLREVTAGYDTIAIAGSHGKTTTTAMIATLLADAGFDPTAVIGGMIPEWQTNARVGTGKLLVIEADEYDYAFLGLEPFIAVVTNVDYDHPDLFPTRDAYQNAFAQFMAQTRRDGVLVVCGDEQVALDLASRSGRAVVTYGLGRDNDWRAEEVLPNARGGSDFTVLHGGNALGQASLQVPGTHNVLNALAAIVVTRRCGAAYAVAGETLTKFKGVGRRFQVHGTFHGAVVIDDYAHHPTEIRATLSAARMRYPHAKIWALFQPHTFSRTRALLDEFANAFEDADRVLVTEIYAARERDAAGLSSTSLVERMDARKTQFVAALAQAEELLRKELRDGDVLVTLGAGNVNQVAARLMQDDYA